MADAMVLKAAIPPSTMGSNSLPPLQAEASCLSIEASMLLSPKTGVSGKRVTASTLTFSKAGTPKARPSSTLPALVVEQNPGQPAPPQLAVGVASGSSSSPRPPPSPAVYSPSAAASAAAPAAAAAAAAGSGHVLSTPVTEPRHGLTANLAGISPSASNITASNIAALKDSSGQVAGATNCAAARAASGQLPSGAIAGLSDVSAAARSMSGSGAAVGTPAAESSATSPTGGQAGNKSGASAPPSKPGSRLCTPVIHNMSLNDAGGKRPIGSSKGKAPGSSGGGGSSNVWLLAKRPHPMQDYKPSRAQLLHVFNVLDSSKSGKITQSVLEEACLSLGFSLQSAHLLFERLDTRKKGFITPSEWGNRELAQTIEAFSLMYLRRFLGLPDVHASPVEMQKYFQAQQQKQIKSLPIAVNLMRVNAVTRGANSALNCGDVIYNAFSFIDADSSGNLSRKELIDGFFVMGVNISEVVADEIMKLFDRDGNGTVEYHEFLKTMFRGQS